MSISRPPSSSNFEALVQSRAQFPLSHDVVFWINFGSHFGTILDLGWPLKLTLSCSGPILHPFERSSSRSKSVSAKSAIPGPLSRCGSAAEGWPLQLKLDSGQLWQGTSHGRHQRADASDILRLRLSLTGLLGANT